MSRRPAASGALLRAQNRLSSRLERLRPQQVLLWLFVLYATYVSLSWFVRDLFGGTPWVQGSVPLAFLLFTYSLLLREPWRSRSSLLFGAFVLPLTDYLLPEMRINGSGLLVSIAVAILTFTFSYARRPGMFALGMVGWLTWTIACEIRDPRSSGFTVEFLLPLALLMGTAGWVAGTVTRHRRRAEEELANVRERRRRERVTLARELHDSVARDLTIIAMQSVVLRTTDRPEEQEYARAAIEQTARSGLDALKRLLVVLRAEDAVESPSLVRDLEAERLPAALAEAARHLALLGYQVTVSGAPGDLPRAAETTAVRVIREGTTNITKHAPTAAVCHLDCAVRQEQLIVRVENRLGDDPEHRVPSTGLGVESLAERLRLLGGTLTSGPVEGSWVLEARIPVVAPLVGTVGPGPGESAGEARAQVLG
ncbi:sensor histidine kinase [Mobilicoccus massiliensis]|uniref:sensor histidine kinase n=1 Tax=Mobilicoccus massiliensis TaxID=1522310 RepID=UPI00058EF698|nr:histidine kinase [Mobilicoccus massiliensis]